MKAIAAVSSALLLLLAVGCAGSSEGAASGSSDLTSNSAQPPNPGPPPPPLTDAMLQAELEADVKGLTYTSEADYPWTYVFAKGDATTPSAWNDLRPLTVDQVRTMFGAYVDNDPDTDKPMAKLVSETRTFEEWTADDLKATCNNANNDGTCSGTKKLDLALKAHLGNLQVYVFGENGSEGVVEGTAVSIFVIGRTAEGNWAGVRTIAIWT